ncbi:MAG: CotH kinase family protein [Flavobacteriales bacterium]|nr:CotH kinase family protein [Flavobacteriales bacterium]
MRTSPILICLSLILLFSCKKEGEIDKYAHTLPRLEITINPEFLWSPTEGLYVIGENGIPNSCDPQPANYNQKWEYPAKIEFFKNNALEFSEEIGLRIKGNCTRTYAMKSFGLYWRSEYGNNKLTYPIFNGDGGTEFKRLLLRNAGNEFGHTHMKDAVNAQIVKGEADVDLQNYRPCVVYLNDQYWGIYNIRENMTPWQLDYRYGVDKDDVDILMGVPTYPEADDGEIDDYMADVVYYLNGNNLADDANYLQFSEVIDVENYVDYIIVQTYVYNYDWPLLNTNWWRAKTSMDYHKWRWMLFDTDRSVRKLDLNKVWLGDWYEKNAYREDRSSGFFIFNHLIKNKGFKQMFLERYTYFLDNVYTAGRTASIIENVKNQIQPEYENHRLRWGLISESSWSRQIDRVKEFYEERTPIMREVINELLDEL